MKRITIKYIITVTIGLLLMVSCKYKDDSNIPRSERYIRATENFKIISSSTSSDTEKALDFLTDSLKFSMEFNEEVTWTITISGLSHPTDHAEKIITGTSMTVDPSQIFWDGASDNIYFFKENEEVEISFEVLGCDAALTKSIFEGFSVASTKDFFRNGRGILIMDYELEKNAALVNDPSTVNMYFDTENKPEGLDSAKFVGTNFMSKNGLLPTPVEGNGLVYLRGIDIVGQPGSFYIGGTNHGPLAYGVTGSLDSTFANFYVNSNGNRTTKLIFEIDGIGGDKFKSEKNITWTGWRLVSVRLSDMILGIAGGLGTGVLRPELMKTLSFAIHSGDGPGKEAEVLIDYVSFTYGTPFKQSN